MRKGAFKHAFFVIMADRKVGDGEGNFLESPLSHLGFHGHLDGKSGGLGLAQYSAYDACPKLGDGRLARYGRPHTGRRWR